MSVIALPRRRQGRSARAGVRRGGRWALLVGLAALEGYLAWRYSQQGALFHFWLHALLGGWLGLTALTLHRLLTGRRAAVGPPEAVVAGHLLAAFPDVLFLAFGVLHVPWMDLFVLHITAHFLWPGALPSALVLWLLALAAHALAVWGRRRTAAGLLVAGLVVLVLAVALRSSLPGTLSAV